MSLKKSSKKAAPKGKLSTEIIESICIGLASLAECDLGRERSWEGWSKSAAEAWEQSQGQSRSDGLLSKHAIREAATSARECAAKAARDWATLWFADKGTVILNALPTKSQVEEAVKDVFALGSGKAGAGSSKVDDKGSVSGAAKARSSLRAVGDDEILPGEAGLPQSLKHLVSRSVEDAIRHGRVLASSTRERLGGLQGLTEEQVESWNQAFVTDAIRSVDHVRSVVVETVLAVLQSAAFERARALADTISRQLAMDEANGSLPATLHEIQASGCKQRRGAKEAGSSKDESSMFWREVRRDAAKLLNRQDVRRLVSMHVL